MLAHCHGDHLVPGWRGVTHLGSISCLIHIILMSMRPAFIAVFVNQVQQCCACVSVCISVGSLWLFLPHSFCLFNGNLSNRTWAHSVWAELQFLVQPLGVRLDSVLWEDCFRTCLWLCFYLNKPNLSLMDCQNTDFGMCSSALSDSLSRKSFHCVCGSKTVF